MQVYVYKSAELSRGSRGKVGEGGHQAKPKPSGHSLTAISSICFNLSYVSYWGRSSWLKLHVEENEVNYAVMSEACNQ